MDDLDFTPTTSTAPTQPTQALDLKEAHSFFSSHGKEQSFAANDLIFSENQKSGFFSQRNRVYLLLEGTVALSVQGKTIGKIEAGEIFGEMASISQTPRAASATAISTCRTFSLDDKQFKAALQDQPEFSLEIMALMSRRLRTIISEIRHAGRLKADFDEETSSRISRKMLAELTDELGENAIMRYPEEKIIMQEGQTGAFMYVVLEGTIRILVGNILVEELGPGSIFGEMAILERTGRLASAIAETDCTVLAVNRNTFVDLVRNQPEFGLAVLSIIGERSNFMVSSFASHT